MNTDRSLQIRPSTRRDEFIECIEPILGRLVECAHGIDDFSGELTPDQAARDIADIVSTFATWNLK